MTPNCLKEIEKEMCLRNKCIYLFIGFNFYSFGQQSLNKVKYEDVIYIYIELDLKYNQVLTTTATMITIIINIFPFFFFFI